MINLSASSPNENKKEMAIYFETVKTKEIEEKIERSIT